jgi:tRNA threonylcarbamoyladenosine biosynthesis protein TsaE
MRDHLDAGTLTLIEWPERAGSLLPPADLALHLSVQDGGRLLTWQANGPRAAALAAALRAAFPY